MDIRTATVNQIAALMGPFASVEEAEIMIADLFSAGYNDTDDVPGGVWDTMVRAAREEAAQYAVAESPSDN